MNTSKYMFAQNFYGLGFGSGSGAISGPCRFEKWDLAENSVEGASRSVA
jgi:hypothetical protein